MCFDSKSLFINLYIFQTKIKLILNKTRLNESGLFGKYILFLTLIDRLILTDVNMTWVTLCLEVGESCSLYIHVYMFVKWFKCLFFCTRIEYK